MELKNVLIDDENITKIFLVKNLKIFPKLISFYHYENFKINKIVLKDSVILSDISKIETLTKKLIYKKNKISIDQLNLEIFDNNKSILKIKNIISSNYGYNKNFINGKIFNKKFKLSFNEKIDSLYFKILNAGVNIEINFDQKRDKNSFSGILKSKILNTNLKFNFNYKDQSLSLYESFLRNKFLSFKNKSDIDFTRFFDSRSKFYIDHIDPKIFKRLDFDKILEFKNIIKTINSKNEINFKAKKFSQNLVDELYLQVDLAYGRLNFSNKTKIWKNFSYCKGNMNLLEDYPKVIFDCTLNLNRKKNFLKKFSINSKNESKYLELYVNGNLNILNNKINFKNISTNDQLKS